MRGGDDRLAAVIHLVRGRYADLIHPAFVAQAHTPATPPVETVPDPGGEVHGRSGADAACLYLIRPNFYIGDPALPPAPTGSAGLSGSPLHPGRHLVR